MDLVIVESPSKAKTIKKYLGKGYNVIASKGHIIDLPKSDLGVDVEKDFSPNYVVTKRTALTAIKKEFKNAENLILAVDLDREGEAIGWHIAQKLGLIDKKGKLKTGKSVNRIVFSEISQSAINEAMQNPRQIDINLVNAQQARRVLDRLVGYKLSPLLWKKIQFGLSAGRVQSVAVRLIVEKEEEREKFKAEEYWSITANTETQKVNKCTFEKFKFDHEREKRDDSMIPFSLDKFKGKKAELKNESEVDSIIKAIEGQKMIVTDVESSESKRNTSAPLITSTLQRNAVNRLGFTAKRTMMAAQKLYEKGFITYMRTDSLSMSQSAIDESRKYIKSNFGDKYLSSKVNVYKSKSKNAQEAHECIRPVSFFQTSDSLNLEGDEQKVYDLIWQKALASQMSPAIISNLTVRASFGKDAIFKVVGTEVKFDGYLKVTKEKSSELVLPEIKIGQEMYPAFVDCVQHFTKPPARYTEASLIKKLEELGIGRPSTYASIISTILSRKYVEKEQKYLIPTDMGIVVTRLLKENFANVVDYDFTASMEDKLDSIAEGREDWVKMLREFYTPFENDIQEKDKVISRDDYKILGDAPEEIVCPVCSSKMIVKLGRYGKFYSCSKFPDCDGMRSMDGKTNEEIENEPETAEFKSMYKSAPETEEGKKYILKQGRFGKFWAHPDYPKVKDAKPLELTRENLVATYGEPPKTEKGKDYLLRKGRFGYFWAHPDYPKVKDIKKIEKTN